MRMTFTRALRRPLLATGFFVASVSVAAADSITLSAVSRGSVASNGIYSGFSGTSYGNFLTGFHSNAEQRSFFVFDLAGVLGPIRGATLTLELNPGSTPRTSAVMTMRPCRLPRTRGWSHLCLKVVARPS